MRLRSAWRWAAVWLMLLCWALSLSSAQTLSGWAGRRTLRCDAPLTPVALERMRRSEDRAVAPLAFSGWEQADGRQVEQEELHRTQRVHLLFVWGDSSRVLPTGVSLPEGDPRGCLLSQDAAQALFGDSSPVGGKIRAEGREYTVRGVFPSPGGTVILPAWADQELTRLSFDRADQSDVEAFLVRHGLSGTVAVAGYRALAALPARLATWLMTLVLLARGYRALHALRAWPVKRALCLLAACALLALWLWAAEFRFALPQALIPTRWSDFEFWQRRVGEWSQAIEQFLTWEKTRPDWLELTVMGKALAFGLLAWELFRGPVRRLAPAAGGRLFCLAGWSFLGSFAAVLLASRLGFGAPESRALWLALPLFWAMSGWASQAAKPREPAVPGLESGGGPPLGPSPADLVPK